MEQAIADQLLKAAEVAEAQVDAELAKLDKMDDDELERLRQKRVDALKAQMKQKSVSHRTCSITFLQEWQHNGHGELTEVANETEFFAATKKSRRVVCHFYRDGAERCKILNMHLRRLAAQHLETRFITANVDRVPFVVGRLNIRIIPTMACIVDGQTEAYIRGFDGIADCDDFETEAAERRLADVKIINAPRAPPDLAKGKAKKNVRDSGNQDDSDSDW